MKADDYPNLAEWLRRKENVYNSPDIQNEIIKIMGLHLLRSLTKELQRSPFLTIMVDETTDAANGEQTVIIIRWVGEDLQVHEEFIGLYSVAQTDAGTITAVITDVFTRLNLPLCKLRGQCYDGASNMSGKRTGVAKRIQELEPRAVYTHCYGHALNLAASDMLKQCAVLKDAMSTSHEAIKLIKYSPRREGIFRRVKENIPGDSGRIGVRTMCPTRWTIKADALGSIITNYPALQSTWDEAENVVHDTKMKARIHGVSAQMKMFRYLYGIVLGELLLKHPDNLSRTLQHKSLSAAEGQQVASMTVQTLKGIRSDQHFDLFWTKVTSKAVDVSEPALPRRRKQPARFDDGLSEGDFPETAKDLHRQQYFEANDIIVACIQDRFDQPGYTVLRTLESLITKACKKEDYDDDLDVICRTYQSDFDKEQLRVQLQLLGDNFDVVTPGGSLNIFQVKDYFMALSHGQRLLMSQVVALLPIILVIPATNATSDRSFSALRRLKSYLRTTMLQERLNYLMLLHVHKERTDALDMQAVLTEFIGESEHRCGIFAARA